jgi:hypothetical protein
LTFRTDNLLAIIKQSFFELWSESVWLSHLIFHIHISTIWSRRERINFNGNFITEKLCIVSSADRWKTMMEDSLPFDISMHKSSHFYGRVAQKKRQNQIDFFASLIERFACCERAFRHLKHVSRKELFEFELIWK